MKTSIGLNVVDIIYLATPVKSIKVTVLAREVPLTLKLSHYRMLVMIV